MTHQEFRNGAGGMLQADAEDLAPFALLRIVGRRIETSRGTSISEAEFVRIWTFARRARAKKEVRADRIRIVGHGTQNISTTLGGDVRVGCTLTSWNELLCIAQRLGLRR